MDSSKGAISKNKLGTSSSSKSEWGSNWEDFRNQTSDTKNTAFDASVLSRLENEDVEDRSSTVGYLKHIYCKVVDPELIEYFNQYDCGDGFITNTKEFSYIRKDNNIYRRKLFSSSEDEFKKDKLNIDFKFKPSKFEEDLSYLGASSAPQKIKPPVDWEKSVYSDIMAGERKKAEEKVEVEKYIEFNTVGMAKKKKEDNELNLLSSEMLDKLEKEVNELKRPTFERLRDKYIADSTTFQVSKSQFQISKQLYDIEIQRENKDDALIASHLSLKSSLADQSLRLQKLKNEIVTLVERKSPYYISEISVPKLGTREHFDPEAIKMFPIVGSDDDISIKDLFQWLSSWASKIGLSEEGLKMAILSRLRGSRAKAWLSYQKQPIKEAITSLSLLFDKNESPQKYANEIKHFSRGANENIENSVQRLIRAIDKWLEGRSDHDKSVLRREYLLEKLDKLLSPRALREVFRVKENKEQIGELLGEHELLATIYKEDLFDKRSEQSSFKLNNVGVSNCSSKDDDIDNLCEEFSNLHINAIEHKRPFNADTETTRPNFKHARNDRKIIHPVRRFEGQNPIVIGNHGKPLIRVGNPNPNNRWHNGGQNSNTYSRPNQNQYSNNQSRSQFMNSRNAPLQQQSNFKPRYNREVEFDRRYQFNGYNEARPQYQNYNGFNDRQRYNYSNNQFRNGFNKNRGNLKHNLSFRTNPPAIFQQISFEELNSICVSCPKEDRKHSVAECPKSKVFRQAKDQAKWT